MESQEWGKYDMPQYNALITVSLVMVCHLKTFIGILDVIGIMDLANVANLGTISGASYLVFVLVNFIWLVKDNKYEVISRQLVDKEPQDRKRRNTIYLWTLFILSVVAYIVVVFL